MVVIFEEDGEEIKMYDLVRGMLKGPVTAKKEVMTMAKLNEKMSKRMSDEIA